MHTLSVPGCCVQSPQFYLDRFPEGPDKVYGFLTGSVILSAGLDHIYTTNYFLSLLALLAASLVACTRTQQWPLAKVIFKLMRGCG